MEPQAIPLYAMLAISAILAALLVYRYDMYEREPWWMLVVAAASGAVVMGILGVAEDAVLAWFGPSPRPALEVAMVAGVMEETARLALALLIAWLLPRQFNDPMDGLIYGSVIGLGMAIEESIWFMQLFRPDAFLLPGSEIIRLAGHLVLGGITCFGVGALRMRLRRWLPILLVCASAAVMLHILWDWVAMDSRWIDWLGGWRSTFGAMVMAAGMMLYGTLVVVGSDWSRQEFSPHQPKELWGWPLTVWRKSRSTRE